MSKTPKDFKTRVLKDRAWWFKKIGSEELGTMIDRCLYIKDFEGLQWVLDYAVIEKDHKEPERHQTELERLTANLGRKTPSGCRVGGLFDVHREGCACDMEEDYIMDERI